MTDDLLPAYVALIRYELKLAPGADALAALDERLRPERAGERPPARAPAIARLRAALHAMRHAQRPEAELDAFAADLRFLALFAPGAPVLDAAGAERLLRDLKGDDHSANARQRGQKPGLPG